MLTVDADADIPAVARARGNNHGRQASRRAGKATRGQACRACR